MLHACGYIIALLHYTNITLLHYTSSKHGTMLILWYFWSTVLWSIKNYHCTI